MDVVKSQRKMLRRKPSSADGDESAHGPTMNHPTNQSTAASAVRGLKKRSKSAPPSTQARRKIFEDYYRVDTLADSKAKVVLPGLPKQTDDLARDLHDFFNLIVLVRTNTALRFHLSAARRLIYTHAFVFNRFLWLYSMSLTGIGT